MQDMKTETRRAIPRGFSDQVMDSNAVFRAVLDAISHPGSIREMPVSLPQIEGVDYAAQALLLTLADGDTPIWLDESTEASFGDYLKFHCGSPITSDPQCAWFGLVVSKAGLDQLENFPVGDDEYPDRSATIVLQVPSLVGGSVQRLWGPGIEGEIAVSPAIDAKFWAFWKRNTALYPRGVDVVFSSGSGLLALPRSSRMGA